MDGRTPKWLGILLLGALPNCGSDSIGTSGGFPAPQVNGGKEAQQVDLIYQDMKPSISSDGEKVLFFSARAPHDRVSRAYKYSYGDSGATRLTGRDEGAERSGRISSDGQWAFLITLEEDGQEGLTLVRVSDGETMLTLEEGAQQVSDLLVTEASPPLVFYGVKRDGVIAYKFLSFKAQGDGLGVQTTQEVDVDPLEFDFTMIATASFTGLLSKIALEDADSFYFRSLSSSALAEKTTWSQDQGGFASSAPTGGALGTLYTTELTDKSVEKFPEGDRDPKLPVYPIEQAHILSDALTTSTLDLPLYRYMGLRTLASDSLAVLLGYEVYACTVRGDEDLYGQTFVVTDGSTSVRGFVTIKEGVYGFQSSDFCSAFEGGKEEHDQPVDWRIRHFELARSPQDGKLMWVWQTWRSGDEEIFYLRADRQGTQMSNIEILNISNNQIPQ